MTDTARQSPRHEMESPVDLPGSMLAGGHPLRWAATTIATASLFLLLTNAESLNGWAAEQTPSPLMVRVTDATEGWLALTEQLGLAAPRSHAHALWKKAQGARFEGQEAAEE